MISAMAMGDKGSLDRETKESFSISGTSHILAVSGLHIGIIFQLFVILLGGSAVPDPPLPYPSLPYGRMLSLSAFP